MDLYGAGGVLGRRAALICVIKRRDFSAQCHGCRTRHARPYIYTRERNRLLSVLDISRLSTRLSMLSAIFHFCVHSHQSYLRARIHPICITVCQFIVPLPPPSPSPCGPAKCTKLLSYISFRPWLQIPWSVIVEGFHGG